MPHKRFFPTTWTQSAFWYMYRRINIVCILNAYWIVGHLLSACYVNARQGAREVAKQFTQLTFMSEAQRSQVQYLYHHRPERAVLWSKGFLKNNYEKNINIRHQTLFLDIKNESSTLDLFLIKPLFKGVIFKFLWLSSTVRHSLESSSVGEFLM